jgi:predicted ABC-type transport system involved in lysophospholipase L1 biosynthesis ATPase subunit
MMEIADRVYTLQDGVVIDDAEQKRLSSVKTWSKFIRRMKQRLSPCRGRPQRGIREITAIIGNSGSGKSTLLNMLGGWTNLSRYGNVDGLNLAKFNDRDLIQYKRETVGFVWQNNARNLIPYLSAAENIELPCGLPEKLTETGAGTA